MPRYGRTILFCSLLVWTMAMGGCQRRPTWNLAPVEGTVTKDGRPLRHVEVVFLADADFGTEGPQAKGTTDESGHYQLRTNSGGNGAVAGKHRVLILDIETALIHSTSAARGSPRKIARHPEQPRVPLNYGRFNETPLRVEVRPGTQIIDLEVEGTP